MAQYFLSRRCNVLVCVKALDHVCWTVCGGLQAGPTAGALSTNPAAYIPDDGLAIAQINELRGELSNKHPLLTAATPLGQNLVSGLSSARQRFSCLRGWVPSKTPSKTVAFHR